MDDPQSDDVPPQMVRTLQIVVAALVAGVFIFGVVAVVARSKQVAPLINQPPTTSYLAVGFSVMALAARAVIVPAVAKAGRKTLLGATSVTATQLMGLLSTRTVVGAAMLEGAAFFLLMAYLLEGQPWALAGGLVMGGLIAVLQFPTTARVERAIAADRQAIEDERPTA